MARKKVVWFRLSGDFEIVKTGEIVTLEDCLAYPYHKGWKLFPPSGNAFHKAYAKATDTSVIR